jgi:hypothetical protein
VVIMDIRPQSETYSTGALPGPAPQRNQVRSVMVKIEQVPEGLRLSTPTAQGWAAVVQNQHQLVAALQAAFTEAQIAAYARWRNSTYDLADLTSRDDTDPLVAPPPHERTRRRPRARRDLYDPKDWTLTGEGRYRSPSGRTYAPESTMGRNIASAWRKLGIE